MRHCYFAADFLVHPTFYDPCSLVVLEALACGLPVLTSRLAGASIAVREGETGELLDIPRDTKEISSKLGSLLERTRTQSGLSPEYIADSVSAYAWANILEKYEEILRDNCTSV